MIQALKDMLASYEPKTPLDYQNAARLLRKRFAEIDFTKAADEVRVFLHDPRELDLWSMDFFLDLATRVEAG